MRILLLEDDVILNELIEEFLISLGYDVVSYYHGLEALDAIYDEKSDLLLLDVGVPSLNGFEVLRNIKESKIDTPAIFITSLNTIDDLQKGFDVGCDDYIKKPFELKELEIRINHIKKIKNIESSDIVDITTKIQYNFANHIIVKESQNIELSRKEAQIFEYFINNKNRIISIEELVSNIWEYDTTPSNATIRTYIKNLRKIVGDEMIVTIKGIGYRFEN
jgi:DNA-binding response OmpR family regulator